MCSIRITKSITPPPSAQPKQWKLLCDGRTVNEGVFSSWNGQRPFSEPAPARRSATYSPTTSSIRVRSRTSAMSLSRIRPATRPSVGAGTDGSGGPSQGRGAPPSRRQGCGEHGVRRCAGAGDSEARVVESDAVPHEQQDRLGGTGDGRVGVPGASQDPVAALRGGEPERGRQQVRPPEAQLTGEEHG